MTIRLSSSSTFVDMDAAIDGVVARFAFQGAPRLQARLDKLFAKFAKFEKAIEADKAGVLNLGFGLVYKAEKLAGISNLTARYKSYEISQAPDAIGLIAAAASTVRAELTYSASAFTEGSDNTGAIEATLTVTLAGDTFKGAVGASLGTVSGIPSGLTAKLVKTSGTEATLTITGKAIAHAPGNTVSNGLIQFSAKDFTSGLSQSKSGLSQALTFQFLDLFTSESGGVLSLSGVASADIVIDLEANTLLIGGAENPLQAGSMASVNTVNASGLGAGAITISVIGDNAAADTVTMPNLNGSFHGGGGNDIITLGSEIYTLVFDATAAENGNDTITGFDRVGDLLDILDFSAFLGAAESRSPDLGVANDPAANVLKNGGVLILPGAGLTNAAALTAAITATEAGKTVVISADVAGNATVWFVTNGYASPTAITADEIEQVATLVGVNNLALTDNQFTEDNFL